MSLAYPKSQVLSLWSTFDEVRPFQANLGSQVDKELMIMLFTAHRLVPETCLIPAAALRSRDLCLLLQRQSLRHSRVNWLAWVLIVVRQEPAPSHGLP